MSYASVLVHVQPGDAAHSRLVCARAVADRFGAVLMGLGAQMLSSEMLSFAGAAGLGARYSRMEAAWIMADRDAVDANLGKAREVFDTLSAGRANEVVWESSVEPPVEAMARLAGAADLIVASHTPDRHVNPNVDAPPADLAMASGRPVLVVPVGAAPLSAEKIVLAWKDTREARRAMADAIPFLKGAKEVLVLEVCERPDADAAEGGAARIAASLKRHEVAATAKVVVSHPADGREILNQTRLFEADLIVAGAYGHSRLQERVFGGVTRSLLGQDDHYLLLSH